MTHLFADNQLIEMVQDMTRRFHQPVKSPGPVLTTDMPWENIPYLGNYAWTILRDAQTGTFRCWYEDWALNAAGLANRTIDITDPSVSKSRLCYAESSDGLTWEKPTTGSVREGGRDTNIVLGDAVDGPEHFGSVHSATIIDDPLSSEPSKRFKMIFQHIQADSVEHDVSTDGEGAPQVLQSPIRAAYSPDGINWTLEPRSLDFGGVGSKLGDVLLLAYDRQRGEYALNTRHPDAWKVQYEPNSARTAAWSLPYYPEAPKLLNKRRVFRTVSPDFVEWSPLNLILSADDEEDNLDESFYALRSWRVGEIELGFMGVFDSVENVVRPQLVSSRDGLRWKRLNKRQPILPLGGAGDWDEYMVIAACEPIRVGDEHWFFYGGSNAHHDWWITGLREGLEVPEASDLEAVRQGIGIARLRLNGLVSLHAGPVREGLLTTETVDPSGSQLEINCACGEGGYVAVELTDANNLTLEGYARDDSIQFTGDAVAHRWRWKNRDGLENRGPVKIRFWMRDADLYSFEWV
jgi:hypothetical protein